jgi:hypothetical protein
MTYILQVIACYWVAFLLGFMAGLFVAGAFMMTKDYDIGE